MSNRPEISGSGVYVRVTGQQVTMGPWTPTLSVSETPSGCRLSLHGDLHGDGPTLQEAADQLMAKVLDVALAFHRHRAHWMPRFAPVDVRWVEFLTGIGALAASGRDVRKHVLGPPPDVLRGEPL